MSIFNSRTAANNAEVNDDMQNKDLNKGLTIIYQEGTQYSTHKENPEYYHVPIAAKKVATTYLKNLKDGEDPHPDAVKLFGIVKNRDNKWVYNPDLSKIGHVNSLGDYMSLPVRSKTYKGSPNEARNLTIGTGIRQPELVIGPDESGEMRYNSNGKLMGKRAGEYVDKKSGKTFLANPLKAMGQAQFEIENDYARLINSGETDIKKYFDVSAKNSQRHHGRKVSDKDPAVEGAENPNWHGLAKGSKPLMLHTHVDSVVNNMANYHDLDTDRLPENEKNDPNWMMNDPTTGKQHFVKHDPWLVNQMQDRLNDAKTARFSKCNCPSCVLDNSVHPENQYWDMQHHKAAATSNDPKVRAAYFAGFPVGQSNELGRMDDMGKVAKFCHHRIFWPTDSAKRYIKHVVQFNEDEKNHKSFVKPKRRSAPPPGPEFDSQFDPSMVFENIQDAFGDF
jgi:hypothetical protein